MFLDFFDMVDSYEDRKVCNTEINGAIIDTCAVTDSDQSYETGIEHPSYNNDNWVIVEMYDTKEEAQIGHAKWVEAFTDKLPESLEDVGTSGISYLIKNIKEREVYNKQQ